MLSIADDQVMPIAMQIAAIADLDRVSPCFRPLGSGQEMPQHMAL